MQRRDSLRQNARPLAASALLALGIALVLAPVLLGAQHHHGPAAPGACPAPAGKGCGPAQQDESLGCGAEAPEEPQGHLCLACFLLRSAQAERVAAAPVADADRLAGALVPAEPPVSRRASRDAPWARGPPRIS